MGITKLLNIGDRKKDVQNKIVEAKTKEEKRKIEQTHLLPEKLPEYSGEKPIRSSLENRTVKIICSTEKEMILLKKYFKVSEYKGQNIRNLDLLFCILRLLEKGALKYNESKKILYYIKKNKKRKL